MLRTRLTSTHRALLSLPLLCLASGLAACLPIKDPPPGAELSVLEGAVSCEGAEKGVCKDTAGRRVQGEGHRVRARARLWRDGERGALQVQLRFVRSSGAKATLVMALPFGDVGPSGKRPEPAVVYEETLAGQRIFSSQKASGRVELSVDRSCPCQTGRFELAFVDPGPDGQHGTADDRQRRLTAGRLRLDGRPFCHRRASLPLKKDVLVLGLRGCPARGVGGPGMSCGFGFGAGMWLDDWNDDGWYDDDWVGDWDEDADDQGWDDGSDWESDGGWDDGADGWGGWGETPSSPGGGDWGGFGGGGGVPGGDDSWDDWGGSDGWGGDDWGSDDWGDDWGGGGWTSDDGWDDGWGDDDWGDDDWGDDDWGDDDWGDDDWGDDDWGDDDWGDDDW